MLKKIPIFVLLVICCNSTMAQNIDIDLLRRFNTGDPTNQPIWKPITQSAYWVGPVYSAGNLGWGLIYHDKKAIAQGTESVMSIAIGAIVSGGFKEIFNRRRPTEKYPDDIRSYTNSTGKSFPSGHAAIAFATATTISLQYKKWYITVPAYAWAASIGYSRMKLGRHYPSDVIGGAVIGIGSGYLSHWLTHKIFRYEDKAPVPTQP